MNIIPKLILDIESSGDSKNRVLSIDESQDLESLFVEYFKYSNGDNVPSDSLLDLFKEVINQHND